MSVPTTNRNYPFPTERLNPYYDDLFDMFQSIDQDVQDAWDAIDSAGVGGSDGQLQYNDAASVAGAEIYYAKATAKLGLRNSSPFFDFDIINDAAGGATVGVRTYHAAANPSAMLVRSRGTAAAPTAVQSGDVLGSLGFLGVHGAGAYDFHQGVAVNAVAAENFLSGAGGADLAIYNTAIGGTVPGLTATFTAAGDLNMYDGGIGLKSYNGTPIAGCVQWDDTNLQVYKNSTWVNLDEASGDPVTLAASATDGGLSIVGQEIGNQVAAANEEAATITSLGQFDTSGTTFLEMSWAEDAWWGTGFLDRSIYRWDGGTSWTKFTNTPDPASGDYKHHTWFDGKLWTGAVANGANPHRVWSFDPTLETWTGHNGQTENLSAYGFGTWDSKLITTNFSGNVYSTTDGTTWTNLGDPVPTSHPTYDPIDVAGTLYVRGGDKKVYKYSGSGTSWSDITVPDYAFGLGDWNGVLVAACLSASTGLGFARVYKYTGSSWTQLGGNIDSVYDFRTLAADSNGDLYARPKDSDDFYKYDEAGDSWSSVITDTADGSVTKVEFNPSDILAFSRTNEYAHAFRDDYMSYDNGYLTGEDWETFSNKADGVVKTDITGQTEVTAVGADYVLISDTGDSGNLKKALVSDFAGGGGMTWQRLAVAGPTAATSGNGYLIDAGSNAVTLNLPATPTAGDVVGVQVYDAANAVTIGRNGSNIEGGTADLLLTKAEAYTFVYAEATEGWVRVTSGGGTIKTTFENTTVTLDTFIDTNDGAVMYDYFISTTGNMRAGTVRIIWDASADDIEKDESSTADIGDTSDFTFTADINSNMVRLRATATGAYLVRLVKRVV